MEPQRSRSIPRSVIRELREAARDRCCVRGHLISDDELNEAAEPLHLHHIVYFSHGGPNTEDNLMLVCPSCHAKIHDRKYRERYPREKLHEAKRHWIRMRDLVPQELYYEAEEGEVLTGPRLTVPFTVESFNLKFLINVPARLTVRELSRFIGNWILRPLVFYARTAPYKSILAKAHIGKVSLALKSELEDIIPEQLTVDEIPDLDHTSLIALTDVRMVHALMKSIDDEEEPPATEVVTLRWGTQPRDLDLHFFHKSRGETAHVWYRERGTLERYPWASLSEDITTGRGPETLSFGLLSRGAYSIAVYNFSNETPLAGCGATVEVAIANTEKIYRCPDEGDGTWWIVLELDVERGTVREINRIAGEPPGEGRIS